VGSDGEPESLCSRSRLFAGRGGCSLNGGQQFVVFVVAGADLLLHSQDAEAGGFPVRHPLGWRQADALSALDAVEGVVALPVGFVGEVAGNQVAAGEEGWNAVQVLGAGQSPKFQHVTGQDASGDGNGIFQLLLFSTARGRRCNELGEKQGQ
jgi:hypothetical protein